MGDLPSDKHMHGVNENERGFKIWLQDRIYKGVVRNDKEILYL